VAAILGFDDDVVALSDFIALHLSAGLNRIAGLLIDELRRTQ